MTETEWLDCDDPMPLLEFLRGKASERKLRLFAVACCHHIWYRLTDEKSHKALRIVEAAADGNASSEQLVEAHEAAEAAVRHVFSHLPTLLQRVRTHTADWLHQAPLAVAAAAEHPWDSRSAGLAADYAVRAVALCDYLGTNLTAEQDRALGLYDFLGTTFADSGAERRWQCQVLRDIAGNPFRNVIIQPDWLDWNNGALRGLAVAIYDEKAFDRMPVLAHALEQAGCTDAAILDHCRSNGPHVRGCWVVDLLLGVDLTVVSPTAI